MTFEGEIIIFLIKELRLLVGYWDSFLYYETVQALSTIRQSNK